MFSRGFQIFLSVLIYICSTLAGMAQTTTPKEARADFFVASVQEEETDNHEDFTWGDAAIMPSLNIETNSENRVDDWKNQRRNHRRAASQKTNHSKCRILKSLPAKSESRGVARNPESQDARQELKAAIRFLHLKSLAC